MPVVGLLLGRAATSVVGGAAEWIGLACVATVGVWLLLEGADERPRAELGLGPLLALGVAVSVDELAIGFAFGLLGVSIGWAVALIAAQALVASQLGFRLGARLAQKAAQIERFAGAALVAASALLLVDRLL